MTRANFISEGVNRLCSEVNWTPERAFEIAWDLIHKPTADTVDHGWADPGSGA